jgi:hypothetical protein
MVEKVLGPIADPELKDVLDRYNRLVMSSLNCVQIGTIEAFNPILNTASVSINCKRKLANGAIYDYPLLTDCPVFILSGGTAFINMPIVKGDTCIVLFSDRDIDNWHLTGTVDVPSSTRMHSLSDGLCIVGIRPLTNALALEAGKAGINAGANLVQIKNAVTDLKAQIDGLIDDIIALTTINCVPGSPVTLSPATIAVLNLRKVAIATLLGS